MPFEPFENTDSFLEDMGMFEAAAHATSVELHIPQPRCAIVALDGSDQQATALALAARLMQPRDGRVVEVNGLSSVADLIGRARDEAADLIVLPVPFGRDAGSFGNESLGSISDMIVVESPLPVLCVRQPLTEQQLNQVLSYILVPAAIHDQGSDRAAGWAFGIVAARGTVELQAVADLDLVEEAKHYVRVGERDLAAFDPDCVLQTFMRELAGLTSAMQHAGRERHLHVVTSAKTGKFLRAVSEHANERPCLLVWGTDHQARTSQFHRGVDLVLACRGPVLLV